MPAAAAANSPIGKARPLVPTWASAVAPAASPAPDQAQPRSSAALSRSPPTSTAVSSPRPAAAMSSRRSRFTAGPSVGRRQGLGALDQQRPAVDGERALAGPAAQQLQAELLVGVALAQQGP